MHQTTFRLLFAGLLVSGAAECQLVEEYRPARANCCLPATAQALADQLQDWNQLGRYHAANEALKTQPPEPKRVVFFGDSITDIWKLAESFPGKPYVNRGISGQTTPQMLVRMFPGRRRSGARGIHPAGRHQRHRPQYRTGDARHDRGDIQAIADLARAHGVKAILCSVTPISDYTARKQSEQRPPADVVKLNAWLREYAAKVHAEYVDYYSALVDEIGMLKDGYSADGLHPNAKGYQLMAPLAEAAIERALQ